MSNYNSFGRQTAHYFDRSHSVVPKNPIESAANWLGCDMRPQQGNWLVELKQVEVAELGTAIDSLLARDADMASVNRADIPLPTLAEKIAGWAHEVGKGRGFVVVRGLPVEEWGEEKTAWAYWTIGHHLGQPGAQNPQNELLGHVVDYDELGNDPMVRRYRTAGNIDFHCDAADLVGLLCLQAAKSGGQSRIVSSVTVFNEVMRRSPELIPRLFEPFFLDRRNEQRAGQVGYFPVQPCCFSAPQELKTFYHSEYFRSVERFAGVEIDPAARQLLDIYDEICATDEYYLDMWLEPGDMQFVSNHTLLHARTAYEDWPEKEQRRHLLRLWISL